MSKFIKATREGSHARIALIGPSGSGKSYTGLILATTLANGGRVAAIDTERGSLSKYADEFDFDKVEPESFSPAEYTELIEQAGKEKYDTLLIDSLTHAWSGRDGALELVDRAAKRSQSNNTYVAWRDVTPLHNQLVDSMISYPGHLVITLRSKMEYVLEKDEKGKTYPRKVGLAPIQREGLEYEFDLVGDMNLDNEWIISKSRLRSLQLSGKVVARPDRAFAEQILNWYNTNGDADKPVSIPQRSDAEIEMLIEVGNANNMDPQKILDLSQKMFGDSPRNLETKDFNILLNNIQGNI